MSWQALIVLAIVLTVATLVVGCMNADRQTSSQMLALGWALAAVAASAWVTAAVVAWPA